MGMMVVRAKGTSEYTSVRVTSAVTKIRRHRVCAELLQNLKFERPKEFLYSIFNKVLLEIISCSNKNASELENPAQLRRFPEWQSGNQWDQLNPALLRSLQIFPGRVFTGRHHQQGRGMDRRAHSPTVCVFFILFIKYAI